MVIAWVNRNLIFLFKPKSGGFPSLQIRLNIFTLCLCEFDIWIRCERRRTSVKTGFSITCRFKVAINNAGSEFFIYAFFFVKEHLLFIESVVSMVPDKNL